MISRLKTLSFDFEYTQPETPNDPDAIVRLFKLREFILPRAWVLYMILLKMQETGRLKDDGRYRLITVIKGKRHYSELHRRVS